MQKASMPRTPEADILTDIAKPGTAYISHALSAPPPNPLNYRTGLGQHLGTLMTDFNAAGKCSSISEAQHVHPSRTTS